MRIMICLETRFLLLTREAKRCIAYEMDTSRGRSYWLFGGLSIQNLLGHWVALVMSIILELT
jgi:hypothetical protein